MHGHRERIGDEEVSQTGLRTLTSERSKRAEVIASVNVVGAERVFHRMLFSGCLGSLSSTTTATVARRTRKARIKNASLKNE
jgi:hypothetical protein